MVEADAQVVAKTRTIDGLGIADFVVRDNWKGSGSSILRGHFLRVVDHEDFDLCLLRL